MSTRFSQNMEMSRLTRDGTAETVSRDQILRRERGQGKVHFPCSADHVQDGQPYTVDPYTCYMCDHTQCRGQAHRYYVVVVVVVVVVAFTLKTVLTSLQYPSLSYSPRQRNEFPWSQANPKSGTEK